MPRDLAAITQQARTAETQRLAAEDQASVDRLQRQKLMLDLIRQGQKLSPTEAKTLANIGTATPEEMQGLYSSVGSKMGFEAIAPFVNARRMAVQGKEQLQLDKLLEDYRSMWDEMLAERKRKLEGISPEEHAALFRGAGFEPPPYGENITRSEATSQLNALVSARKPAGGASQLPEDVDFMKSVAGAAGLTLPPEAAEWSQQQFRDWTKAATGAKPKETKPGEELRLQKGMQAFVYRSAFRGAPPIGKKTDDSKHGVRKALADAIAARAIQRGGNDLQANASAILREHQLFDKNGKARPWEKLNEDEMNDLIDTINVENVPTPDGEENLTPEEQKTRKVERFLRGVQGGARPNQ